MEINYDYQEGEEEEHKGVAESDLYPYLYTYEHSNGFPGYDEEIFRVTSYINHSNEPDHVNKYFIPCEYLDEFMVDQHQTGEEIIDIRPISLEEMIVEISDYDDDVSEDLSSSLYD